MKKWAKWLAAAGIPALVILLTLQGGDEVSDGVGLSLVNMTVSQKDSVVRVEISNAKIGDEIISMRSATAKITKLGSNKFNAMISTVPQHYLDEETQTYKDIDLTIYEVVAEAKNDPKRKFDKYVNAGNYSATWFDDKPHDYTLWVDDYYVTFAALFDTTNIDIVTEQQKNGMKQSVILMNANADTSYSWTISSNASFTFADGVTTFKDSSDNFLFRIPQATAWDDNGIDIPVAVTLVDSTFTYTISVPDSAAYPITIDPTVRIDGTVSLVGYIGKSSNSSWSDVRDSATGSESGGNPRVQSNYTATPFWLVRRAFFGFDTSSLPDNALISSAVLTVYVNTASIYESGDEKIWMVTGTHSSIATSEYNNFTGWASNGVYSLTDLFATNLLFSDFSAGADTMRQSLSAGGIATINLTGTTKFSLIAERDRSDTSPAIGENNLLAMAAGSEYLKIVYTVPPNAPTNFAIADSATTTLSYTWDDNSGDEDGFFIKNTADTLTVGSFAANATTGEVTGLDIAKSYQFFVVSYNTDGESSPSGNVTQSTVFALNHTYTDSISITNFTTNKMNDTDPAVSGYSEVRRAIDTSFISSTAVDTLGQLKSGGGKFHIYRTSIAATKPDWANEFVTAILKINLVADQSDTDFNLQVFKGTWVDAAAHDVHYFSFDGREGGLTPYTGTSLASPFSTSAFSAGILELTFNSDGLTTLKTISQASDSLKLVIISSRDSSATEPAALEYITLNDTNARIVYTWRRNSVVSSGLVIHPQSTTSARASWLDNSIDEDSFRVERTDNTFLGSVVADDTTLLITGLSINEFQNWRIENVGGVTDTETSNAESTWTWAAIPGKVTVSYPSTSEIKIILDINSNPAYTKFAIQDSISGKYVHLLGAGVDDTLRTAVDWNTYAEWGGANGDTVVAVPAKLYRFRSKSRNTNQ